VDQWGVIVLLCLENKGVKQIIDFNEANRTVMFHLSDSFDFPAFFRDVPMYFVGWRAKPDRDRVAVCF
jgi:hypothetical protein